MVLCATDQVTHLIEHGIQRRTCLHVLQRRGPRGCHPFSLLQPDAGALESTEPGKIGIHNSPSPGQTTFLFSWSPQIPAQQFVGMGFWPMMRVSAEIHFLVLLVLVAPSALAAANTNPVVDLGYARYKGTYNSTIDLNIFRG